MEFTLHDKCLVLHVRKSAKFHFFVKKAGKQWILMPRQVWHYSRTCVRREDHHSLPLPNAGQTDFPIVRRDRKTIVKAVDLRPPQIMQVSNYRHAFVCDLILIK